MRGAGIAGLLVVLWSFGALAPRCASGQDGVATQALPDAPSFTVLLAGQSAAPQPSGLLAQDRSRQPPAGQNAQPGSSEKPAPCPTSGSVPSSKPQASPVGAARTPCAPQENPYRRFLNSTTPTPLTPRQKGTLAFRNVVDPFNLLTVVGNAGVTVAADSHSAYGPGWKGFGRDSGYSLLEDATGEFIGTFLVCSVFSEDPHYHRMPDARPMRRAFHAISRTLVAQNDDGRPMVNYETLIGYTAGAELSNLYIPGIHGNVPSTAARIVTGIATDPISNLITEFLPDVASRVHIRIVFVQQVINDMATRQEQNH